MPRHQIERFRSRRGPSRRDGKQQIGQERRGARQREYREDRPPARPALAPEEQRQHRKHQCAEGNGDERGRVEPDRIRAWLRRVLDGLSRHCLKRLENRSVVVLVGFQQHRARLTVRRRETRYPRNGSCFDAEFRTAPEGSGRRRSTPPYRLFGDTPPRRSSGRRPETAPSSNVLRCANTRTILSGVTVRVVFQSYGFTLAATVPPA